MTSIRKTKKALKRKIRRIDALLLKSPQEQAPCLSMPDWWASASNMWDLYLWRNYFERKLKALGSRWTGECIKPIKCKLPSNIEQLITLINNGKSK